MREEKLKHMMKEIATNTGINIDNEQNITHHSYQKLLNTALLIPYSDKNEDLDEFYYAFNNDISYQSNNSDNIALSFGKDQFNYMLSDNTNGSERLFQIL
ncbi:2567_t:CDS:2 [Scutellospora calospora]|uniref:2567_t:CDS:1 n=1 Tax=Scutellospora calospora TaxID=85575 RepID=A0ACA9K4Q9_9GLOM|nr:2567_t:CDS:2 [Scutellospora calospora]